MNTGNCWGPMLEPGGSTRKQGGGLRAGRADLSWDLHGSYRSSQYFLPVKALAQGTQRPEAGRSPGPVRPCAPRQLKTVLVKTLGILKRFF